MTSPWYQALRSFADNASAKLASVVHGEPEEQLRPGLETLLAAAADHFSVPLLVKGESAVRSVGRPDFAVIVRDALTGYVELKKPGSGARTSRFKGHDARQWKKFASLPNLIYTDGNEWGLYQNGKLQGQLVRLTGDLIDDGADAVTEDDADKLARLLRKFVDWTPLVPNTARELAELIAPLCRLLRDEVVEALEKPGSKIHGLKRDWQGLLFPDATDPQFADAYAQTVTFALLLSRAEGWHSRSLDDAIAKLKGQHGLLSRALDVLTDQDTVARIATSLDVLRRVVAAVEPAVMRAAPESEPKLIEELSLRPDDPWTYFYEDFLAAYDPKLRKDAGVYYTPVEVVRCQVRLVDDLLKTKLGKPAGFADPTVTTLDPAMGTGTYLLGVIDQALDTTWQAQGKGAMAGVASQLASTLHGFERLVGPYAVAELRLTQAIQRFGGSLPTDGLDVLLTDTLESPRNAPKSLSSYHAILTDQHRRALAVKNDQPILVCLGNPPYDRHDASTNPALDRGRTGAWVRHGDPDDPGRPILDELLATAKKAGHGGDLKNLYNLYVYFWRWALWKTFECPTDNSGGRDGPGVVSFITASSFLTGDAFVGLRKLMRQHCDRILILDLGGEGRGTRQEDNVFAIQTPVCITVAYRSGQADPDTPARVTYRRLRGSQKEKFAALGKIHSFDGAGGDPAPDGWLAPFTPAVAGQFAKWPDLRDLFPWQHSGVQAKRIWPIGVSREVLEARWRDLLSREDRATAFKESGDRRIDSTYGPPLTTDALDRSIAELPEDASIPAIVPYGYRSFDRQFIFADAAFLSRSRPPLWQTMSERQVFFESIFSVSLGDGPAVTVATDVPDNDYFRGSFGAKATIPLYRDAAATEPNVWPGLLDKLTVVYERKVSAEDLAAYVYGVLGHPGYTSRFWDELESCEVRVPLTRDVGLFDEAAAAGRRLIFLHTYAQRMPPEEKDRGVVPRGEARCRVAVPGEPDAYPRKFGYDAESMAIRVGGEDLFEEASGGGAGVFGPVSPEVWGFEVSGLKVVQSWLGYRMAERKGRSSSPLDEIRPERWTPAMTTQLLELLWMLEATVAMQPGQAGLLERIVKEPLLKLEALPEVPGPDAACRRPPRAGVAQGEMFDG